MKRIQLETEDQINEIISESQNEHIIIFKHSTTCGISKMVFNKFEKNFDKLIKDIKYYYLDLLKYRSLSNFVAEKFDITHQSPQVLLIKNGEVIYHKSHFSISIDKINSVIE